MNLFFNCHFSRYNFVPSCKTRTHLHKSDKNIKSNAGSLILHLERQHHNWQRTCTCLLKIRHLFSLLIINMLCKDPFLKWEIPSILYSFIESCSVLYHLLCLQFGITKVKNKVKSKSIFLTFRHHKYK